MNVTQVPLPALCGPGLFADLDVAFADFCLRTAGVDAGSREGSELSVLAALASHATTSRKHVCALADDMAGQSLADALGIEIDDQPPQAGSATDAGIATMTVAGGSREVGGLRGDDPRLALARTVIVPTEWDAIARRYPTIIGGPVAAARTPLVLERARLYLRRYWQYEREVANRILARCGPARDGTAEHSAMTGDTSLSGVSPYLSPLRGGELNWQLVSVFAALRQSLAVITGGPGTGKTSVVAAILAILIERFPDLRVALCAPTGKAQARLKQAVENELPGLRCSKATVQRLAALQASTIHRLLGWRYGTPYFRHDMANPLPVDVAIVDEASMIDQPLMAKLLRALRPEARVVLLGDKDQLTSVETGSVLADVCSAARIDAFSPAFCAAFNRLHAGEASLAPARDARPIDDCVVQLKVSHRFSGEGGIGLLSADVNAGRTDGAVDRLLRDGRLLHEKGSVHWRPLPARAEFGRAMADFVDRWRTADGLRLGEYLKARHVDEAMARLSRFQVITSHRRGAYGSSAVNILMRNHLKRSKEYSKGLPVIVTSNDHALRIYNGDIGLCWPDEEGQPRVFFEHPEDRTTFRSFLPTQLPDHEPVFAMSTHKAQGSGFANVLFILSGDDSPLHTREMIYTAITRAASRVDIWCSQAALRNAIQQQTRRPSGLESLLRDAVS